MIPRVRRVYWIKGTKDRPNILVFDGGYAGGDIHIYEHKESVSSEEAEKVAKEYLGGEEIPEENLPEVGRYWVEKKFGHNVAYDLKG